MGAMAVVNYSVPDEVKTQFNRAFARENKSSVIARLMRQAVEKRSASAHAPSVRCCGYAARANR